MEIQKVLSQTNGSKYIPVPKRSNIQKGDIVKVIRLNPQKLKELEDHNEGIKKEKEGGEE